MSSVKTFYGFILAIICFYGAAAVCLRYLYPLSPEIFPLYAWNLFAHVPNNKTEYVLEIMKYNGKLFVPPVKYSQAATLGLKSGSVEFRALVQDFSNSYIQKLGNFESYRNLLEKGYLGKTETYRIIKQEYNPLDMYKNGISREYIVATFEKEVEAVHKP